MAADVVVGECRLAGSRFADFTVGDEASFDESLEAIADSEDESIAVLEKVHDGIGDAGATQDGGDKFSGACWFISGAESTWDSEDLRLGNLLSESDE